MGFKDGLKGMLGKLTRTSKLPAAAANAENALYARELRSVRTGTPYGALPGASRNFNSSGNLPKKP